MTKKQIFTEYTRIETSPGEGRIFYDCFEDTELLSHMKRGYSRALAIFGEFEIAADENTGNRTLRWTVYLGTDKEHRQYGSQEWAGCHESSVSEYWDDKSALLSGQVEWFR